MELINKFQANIHSYTNAAHFWVAFSGGVDSLVLLHLLMRLRDTQQLTVPLSAIHIDHQLQQNSSDWMKHCEEFCQKHHISFYGKKIEIQRSPKESLEAIAREKRYEAIEAFIGENHYLLTAHHQDDQAETVLLQLLRGAGPKGLSAMPAVSSFGQGYHARPLLDFPKEILQNYAHENQLLSVEDPSNTQTKFSRNFLRHEIMPLLKNRWPSCTETISRSAALCGNAQVILEEIARADLKNALKENNQLSIVSLLTLSIQRQQQLLRCWVERSGFLLPSKCMLDRILNEMLVAKDDANPLVQWNGAQVRRFDDCLFIMKPFEKIDLPESIVWHDISLPITLPGDLGIFQIEDFTRTPEMYGHQLVEIRFRKGGEKFITPGNTHHTTLKNWFWQNKIPPWLRSRMPLLFVNGVMVAVGHKTR